MMILQFGGLMLSVLDKSEPFVFPLDLDSSLVGRSRAI
jgi:hypothetical protein